MVNRSHVDALLAVCVFTVYATSVFWLGSVICEYLYSYTIDQILNSFSYAR